MCILCFIFENCTLHRFIVHDIGQVLLPNMLEKHVDVAETLDKAATVSLDDGAKVKFVIRNA
jgi:hypothetical protein